MSPRDPMALQDADGLLFWPRASIARVRREYGGRLEVTSADGGVAHRPGPLEAVAGAPFVAAGEDALVNPGLVRRRGGRLEIPGGGTMECPAGWPRKAPAATPPPSTTVALGRRSLDLARLRAVRMVGGHRRAFLDEGVEMGLDGEAAEIVREALGLPSLDELLPTTDALRWLYREGMRDWPFELYEAEAALLRKHFAGKGRGDGRRLMAHAIWQAYRYSMEGRKVPYGTTIRGLWYVPVLNVLDRAGLRSSEGPGMLSPDLFARDGSDRQYLSYETLLAEMVGERRLFTYRELGIEEPRQDLHAVGTRAPEVVLYVEKWSLKDGAAVIVDRFGPSHIVMGGVSTYLATEFFVERLRAAGVGGPLTVMAYVDFDPLGWEGVEAFRRHLARYGMEVARVGYLVRPGRFTGTERRLHSLPLSAGNPQVAARNRAWVEASGGVDGRARGMHADHLWPFDRVVRAYEEEMRGVREEGGLL